MTEEEKNVLQAWLDEIREIDDQLYKLEWCMYHTDKGRYGQHVMQARSKLYLAEKKIEEALDEQF